MSRIPPLACLLNHPGTWPSQEEDVSRRSVDLLEGLLQDIPRDSTWQGGVELKRKDRRGEGRSPIDWCSCSPYPLHDGCLDFFSFIYWGPV